MLFSQVCLFDKRAVDYTGLILSLVRDNSMISGDEQGERILIHFNQLII